MNKKHFIFLLLPFALCSCFRTSELYSGSAYNSPIFDENYYTNYDGLDELTYSDVFVRSNPVFNYDYSYMTYCYTNQNNLSLLDEGFGYGLMSKLYDGRTFCDNKHQLSRVQIDKTGFGTRLPISQTTKQQIRVKNANKFVFAVRGGTSTQKTKIDSIRRDNMTYNFEISFYKETAKIVYKLNNVLVPTDCNGETVLVKLNLDTDITGTFGYSIKFNCACLDQTTKINTQDVVLNTFLTDDKTDTEKDHLAIMLYEVIFEGDSFELIK